MYYIIEFFGKEEMTLKTITESHFHEIVDDLPYYENSTSFYQEDSLTIKDKTKITIFYKDKEKRDMMVMKLLGCDNHLYEERFVIPHPANDIFSPIIC